MALKLRTELNTSLQHQHCLEYHLSSIDKQTIDLSKLLHVLGVTNSDEGQMWPPAAPTSNRPKSALKVPPACDDKVCDDTTLASVVASFFNVDSPQSTVDSAPATRGVRFAPTANARGVFSASSQAQDKAQHNVPTYHSADHERRARSSRKICRGPSRKRESSP